MREEVRTATDMSATDIGLPAKADAQREQRIAAGAARKIIALLRAYDWRVVSGGPRKGPEHLAPGSQGGNTPEGDVREAIADHGRTGVRIGKREPPRVRRRDEGGY